MCEEHIFSYDTSLYIAETSIIIYNKKKGRFTMKQSHVPTVRSYDPTNDLLFKFVFGREERKNITLQLINDILGRDGDDAFVDLQFRNTEISPDKDTDKLGRLDIFGILNDGSRIDIEMQVVNRRNMEKRTLFYWSHMYLHFDSLHTGDDYGTLKPAISINILRYSFLPQEDPHAAYVLYNPKTHHRLTDDLEIHFLEIPKYKDKPIQSMDRIEKWLAFFANKLDEDKKEELAMKNTAIKDAMQASDRYIMDDAAYREYIARESAIWDYNSDLKANLAEGFKQGREAGMKQGLEQGLEQGRKQGEQKARETAALDMLRDNMDINLIMKYTGLSADRIAELAKEL